MCQISELCLQSQFSLNLFFYLEELLAFFSWSINFIATDLFLPSHNNWRILISSYGHLMWILILNFPLNLFLSWYLIIFYSDLILWIQKHSVLIKFPTFGVYWRLVGDYQFVVCSSKPCLNTWSGLSLVWSQSMITRYALCFVDFFSFIACNHWILAALGLPDLCWHSIKLNAVTLVAIQHSVILFWASQLN